MEVQRLLQLTCLYQLAVHIELLVTKFIILISISHRVSLTEELLCGVWSHCAKILSEPEDLYTFRTNIFCCLASLPCSTEGTGIEITRDNFIHSYAGDGPSEWPRGLRHEMSSPARTLGSRVRIPLQPLMSAFILCLCVGSGLATGWSPVQGVYRLS
jgi:hypothetical protein